MAGAKNEFTNLTRLTPEAIGEPGKRTFRVMADSGSSSATIWLEKEQLFQLALGDAAAFCFALQTEWYFRHTARRT